MRFEGTPPIFRRTHMVGPFFCNPLFWDDSECPANEQNTWLMVVNGMGYIWTGNSKHWVQKMIEFRVIATVHHSSILDSCGIHPMPYTYHLGMVLIQPIKMVMSCDGLWHWVYHIKSHLGVKLEKKYHKLLIFWWFIPPIYGQIDVIFFPYFPDFHRFSIDFPWIFRGFSMDFP